MNYRKFAFGAALAFSAALCTGLGIAVYSQDVQSNRSIHSDARTASGLPAQPTPVLVDAPQPVQAGEATGPVTLGSCPPADCDANNVGEPCRSDFNDPADDPWNGGCNQDPPAFQPTTCGTTLCGYLWAGTEGGQGVRDLDWFALSIHKPTEVTWSAVTDLPVPLNLWIARLDPKGKCEQLDIIVFNSADCTNSITAKLDPGLYTLIIAPAAFAGATCSAGPFRYEATIECVHQKDEECPEDKCPGDLNGDKVVDGADLLTLLANWGECPKEDENCEHGFVCGDIVQNCIGFEGTNCYCWNGFDGDFVCGEDGFCSDLQTCPTGVCPPGYVCAVDTCCPDNVCVPDCKEEPEPICDEHFVCDGSPIVWCNEPEFCACMLTFGGSIECLFGGACLGGCPDGTCPSGQICVVDTCCSGGAPTCIEEIYCEAAEAAGSHDDPPQGVPAPARAPTPGAHPNALGTAIR
jgi:hypothetical protein